MGHWTCEYFSTLVSDFYFFQGTGAIQENCVLWWRTQADLFTCHYQFLPRSGTTVYLSGEQLLDHKESQKPGHALTKTIFVQSSLDIGMA